MFKKVKTIDLILKKSGYTKIKLDNFLSRDIVNGCGGAKGFNFSDFANYTIKYFPKFNNEKFKKLLEDFKYICCLHDIDYTLGNNFLDKIKADIKLGYRIFKLLRWTTFFKSLGSGLAVFTALTLRGKKYFYSKEKYKLRSLIIK